MLGDHSEREPPDPIPNSEVKPLSADDSVAVCHAKVGNCQALIFTIKPKIFLILGFFVCDKKLSADDFLTHFVYSMNRKPPFSIFNCNSPRNKCCNSLPTIEKRQPLSSIHSSSSPLSNASKSVRVAKTVGLNKFSSARIRTNANKISIIASCCASTKVFSYARLSPWGSQCTQSNKRL